ncbi:MAG: hypothetical protein LUQ62_04440 [Methanomicrobiales archaeon]|nr:hypothetical protein [Methanomicrobiales archaeon]
MHGITFTCIAERARDYPLVWRRGQVRKTITAARDPGGCSPDPTGRWLLLNTLETNRLLQGQPVHEA